MEAVNSIFKFIILLEWLVIFSGWVFSIIKIKEGGLPIYKVASPWKCRSYGILAFLAAFTALLPWGKFPTSFWPPIIFAAFFISFCGPILYYWARLNLKKHWSSEARIINDHKLITTGPYQFARHPIYLSKIILAFATSIVFNSWLALLFTSLLIISAVYQAKTEEELLKKYFKNDYDEYSKKVPMLFPNIFKIYKKFLL